METNKFVVASVKLRERGQATLPKALREALHLESGDSLRAVKIANAIVLMPLRMNLESLRKQMRKAMKQRGVSADDLLRGL